MQTAAIQISIRKRGPNFALGIAELLRSLFCVSLKYFALRENFHGAFNDR